MAEVKFIAGAQLPAQDLNDTIAGIQGKAYVGNILDTNTNAVSKSTIRFAELPLTNRNNRLAIPFVLTKTFLENLQIIKNYSATPSTGTYIDFRLTKDIGGLPSLANEIGRASISTTDWNNAFYNGWTVSTGTQGNSSLQIYNTATFDANFTRPPRIGDVISFSSSPSVVYTITAINGSTITLNTALATGVNSNTINVYSNIPVIINQTNSPVASGRANLVAGSPNVNISSGSATTEFLVGEIINFDTSSNIDFRTLSALPTGVTTNATNTFSTTNGLTAAVTNSSTSPSISFASSLTKNKYNIDITLDGVIISANGNIPQNGFFFTGNSMSLVGIIGGANNYFYSPNGTPILLTTNYIASGRKFRFVKTANQAFLYVDNILVGTIGDTSITAITGLNVTAGSNNVLGNWSVAIRSFLSVDTFASVIQSITDNSNIVLTTAPNITLSSVFIKTGGTFDPNLSFTPSSNPPPYLILNTGLTGSVNVGDYILLANTNGRTQKKKILKESGNNLFIENLSTDLINTNEKLTPLTPYVSPVNYYENNSKIPNFFNRDLSEYLGTTLWIVIDLSAFAISNTSLATSVSPLTDAGLLNPPTLYTFGGSWVATTNTLNIVLNQSVNNSVVIT